MEYINDMQNLGLMHFLNTGGCCLYLKLNLIQVNNKMVLSKSCVRRAIT